MKINHIGTKELPKWFDGEHYSDGDTVTNPFSGESFYLDRTELSMYDFIMGCSITFEQGGLFTDCDPQLVRDFDKGRDWFRETNMKAYMTLLD